MLTLVELLIASALLAGLTHLLLYPERYRRRDPAADLRRLVALCRGDRTVAARLVAYEQKHAPGITEAAATARACRRLERERSR